MCAAVMRVLALVSLPLWSCNSRQYPRGFGEKVAAVIKQNGNWQASPKVDTSAEAEAGWEYFYNEHGLPDLHDIWEDAGPLDGCSCYLPERLRYAAIVANYADVCSHMHTLAI